MTIKKLLRKIPDPMYLTIKYRHHFGKRPDLRHPKTFNEKLQWLKLHDRRPIYTTMVDKVQAKDYVAGIIGEEHIIPTLGVWESADEIDFNALPDRFVIKCNHDSHGVIVCKDKSKLDEAAVRAKLNRRLTTYNGYYYGREWPYKNVEKRIIAEEYISDGSEELTDYKVHNFNGEPRFILVCRERFSGSGLKEDFYDTDWNLMDVRRPGVGRGEPLARPKELGEMLELSRVLSRGVPFLRTDFYCVGGRVLFGELTLYPASGFQPFEPASYDRTFGDWIDLPEPNGGAK